MKLKAYTATHKTLQGEYPGAKRLHKLNNSLNRA